MMKAIFGKPLAMAATVIAVGIGSMTVSAPPAAALTDRDALGLALGVGAAAVLLNQIDRDNDGPRRHHYAPPPPPRYSQYRDRWDRGPDRGPDPRYMGPGRRGDFGPGPQRGWR